MPSSYRWRSSARRLLIDHGAHQYGLYSALVGRVALLFVTSGTLAVLMVHGGGHCTPSRTWCGCGHVSASLWRSGADTRGQVAVAASSKAWEVLGLDEGADRAEIKRRYRQLVATEHPDKKPDDPNAAAKFSSILAAYQELMDHTPQKYNLKDYGNYYGQASASEAADFAAKYGGSSGRTARSKRSPPPPPEQGYGYAGQSASSSGQENSNDQMDLVFVVVGVAAVVIVLNQMLAI